MGVEGPCSVALCWRKLFFNCRKSQAFALLDLKFMKDVISTPKDMTAAFSSADTYYSLHILYPSHATFKVKVDSPRKLFLFHH